MRERLNIYQVAKRFNVSSSTIFQWRVKGWIIEPTRLGGRVFWPLEDLEQWEADGFPKPCEQKEKNHANTAKI